MSGNGTGKTVAGTACGRERYDNEWAYSCRLADLAALVGASLR